ncbi:hypothetical protein [Pseudescherichia sp.]|uniref:hypothetical protein n=1 Tax=Pseudescherichia sp. TaxID=2055881 RepID=UPI002898A8B9|nr:hypothetical protein [Pseudescherichia sp.]
MKNITDVMLTCGILESRFQGESLHPICIHRVAFNNGKFALIRSVSNICFANGSVLKRSSQGWFSESKPEKLLPFEYISEQESIRRFREG